MISHANYYLCKIKDHKLYEYMLRVYLPNISDATLQEYNHTWHTQFKKPIIVLVAKYNEKEKTYSKIMSIVHLVSVATGSRNRGYFTCWNGAFVSIDIAIGDSLTALLVDKD